MKYLPTIRLPRALALLGVLPLALLALSTTARAQDVKPEITPVAKPDVDKAHDAKGAPEKIIIPNTDADEAHEQMEKLFGEVERKMLRVNRLLQEASAGKPRAQASGELHETIETIEKLLQETTESSRSAVEDIDKILELADHPHSSGTCSGKTGGMCKSSGSSSSPSGKPSSKPGGKTAKGNSPGQSQGQPGQTPSPLDRQGTATAQRESTPQGPEQGGQKPDGQGDKPGSQPKEGQNGMPRGNRDSQGLAQNSPGQTPPGSALDKTGVQPSAQDRWGDLPELPREIFRMQGSGDMPARYRDWIDAYYRRLNQKPN